MVLIILDGFYLWETLENLENGIAHIDFLFMNCDIKPIGVITFLGYSRMYAMGRIPIIIKDLTNEMRVLVCEVSEEDFIQIKNNKENDEYTQTIVATPYGEAFHFLRDDSLLDYPFSKDYDGFSSCFWQDYYIKAKERNPKFDQFLDYMGERGIMDYYNVESRERFPMLFRESNF